MGGKKWESYKITALVTVAEIYSIPYVNQKVIEENILENI